MDLIFFDLDGTLLNKASELSTFTTDTLHLLREKNIAHTVATGRTMLSAQRVIGHHPFELPHIYSNGVTVWDPRDNGLKLDNLLDHSEMTHIVECALSNDLAPFVNTVATVQSRHQHFVYHGPLQQQIEQDLVKNYFVKSEVTLMPLSSLPGDSNVTNISMIGETDTVQKVDDYIKQFDTLVAYSGTALEGNQYSWIDIHHRLANKGSAVVDLTTSLGGSNIICFGDSYNDLSMFALADECYAPKNAKDEVKAKASEVIGDHHEDGVAHFLRERFSL